MPSNILIVDDEEPLRKLLARIIGLEGFSITEAGTIHHATEILHRKQIDIVLCDVKLPDGNGVEFTRHIKAKYPDIEIIVLTAYGNIPDGVQAIKNGAFDYLTKGNDNDRIIPLVFQALDQVKERRKSSVKIRSNESNGFETIIGNSPAIEQAIIVAKKIAPTDISVLLLGETGTGKEVFANAIHHASKRSSKPFIAINCSAFNKELLEGELFGHKAGAFTGALKDKKGLIELANEGTMFLDEIGEMSFELQAKLLRVLENGEFIRLGDSAVTRVSVRIIAATNRNLALEVERGAFREDLFYRLNAITISLPSLRERRDDIEELANHFLKEAAKKQNRGPLKISPEALVQLKNYQWKGNIRQLRNVMERAAILADTGIVTINDLPPETSSPANPGDQFLLTEVERDHIIKMLKHTAGNKTRTAQLLGIGIATLYRKLEEFGIPK